MEWRDTGFVLAVRRHGESALIAELLTREHGRHAGLVRGGQSPRRRALLQPANQVIANWRGRLPEHLGSLDCELVEAHAARFLDDPDRLAAVSRAAAAPYRDKLLALPTFLWRDSPAERRDIAAGLALTGYFLLHHLSVPHGRQLPEARERLAERMRRPRF